LAFGYLADQSLTLLGGCRFRGKKTTALFIWDDLGDAAFQYCHARVCSAEVYSNDFPHDCLLSTPKAKNNKGLIINNGGGLRGFEARIAVSFNSNPQSETAIIS